ncbi:unnamed protein product [Adineta steineri]|uniref:FF domain-containing protein n=1 Tax=Adineta steineri TaxID=433720 RepID=A0A814BB44_9BILA|nr:unnamed protein product [Adineta steineri]
MLAASSQPFIPTTYASNANVSIDYIKQGGCNSSILVRVGDYCDYILVITIPTNGGSSASTDLNVEIIMPDNATIVMQMSKPSVTYVGQTCYLISFQFGITASTINAAYFTTAFVISSGDNLMCMKTKATPFLSSGGSTLYNASMYLDLGTLCYYPIDPTNITASTLIIQANIRIPVTTTVPVNNQLSVTVGALVNNNQSTSNTTVPLTVKNYTAYTGFTSFSNDTSNVLITAGNSTMVDGIRQMATYGFKIYLPTDSQGSLQITISSIAISNSVTVDIQSATILSAGINVGSFMYEYALGNKYQWTYSSSVGSSYTDTAYLDLGVITNTGVSLMQNNFSNLTDNFIYVQATGYLTDCPAAEQNTTFTVGLNAMYAGHNISKTYSQVVARNGTEKPVMLVNHTDITSGNYGMGSTYSGVIQYSHANNSNAECINAQIIIYIPTWVSYQSYNSSTLGTNYTTDNATYIIFNLGTLLFNDAGILTFSLNIGTSNQMALVYQRYNAPSLKKDYFSLLKELKVTQDSSWSDIKRSGEHDQRYKAIESSSRREDWFREYQTKHIDETTNSSNDATNEEDLERQREKEKQERIDASIKKRAEEVKEQLSGFQRELDKEREQLKKDKAIENFKALLTDMVRTADAEWKDTKKALRKDPRWNQDIDRDEKESLFEEHVNLLEKKRKMAFHSLLSEHCTLSSTWKEVKKNIKTDVRFEKIFSNDHKRDLEREFELYMKYKYDTAKKEFKELLKETKIITHKSLRMIRESEEQNHLRDIEKILQKDKRYLLLDVIPEERSRILMNYIEDLQEQGEPPPPTASLDRRKL